MPRLAVAHPRRGSAQLKIQQRLLARLQRNSQAMNPDPGQRIVGLQIPRRKLRAPLPGRRQVQQDTANRSGGIIADRVAQLRRDIPVAQLQRQLDSRQSGRGLPGPGAPLFLVETGVAPSALRLIAKPPVMGMEREKSNDKQCADRACPECRFFPLRTSYSSARAGSRISDQALVASDRPHRRSGKAAQPTGTARGPRLSRLFATGSAMPESSLGKARVNRSAPN